VVPAVPEPKLTRLSPDVDFVPDLAPGADAADEPVVGEGAEIEHVVAVRGGGPIVPRSRAKLEPVAADVELDLVRGAARGPEFDAWHGSSVLERRITQKASGAAGAHALEVTGASQQTT
jgi:hypothetical protein